MKNLNDIREVNLLRECAERYQNVLGSIRIDPSQQSQTFDATFIEVAFRINMEDMLGEMMQVNLKLIRLLKVLQKDLKAQIALKNYLTEFRIDENPLNALKTFHLAMVDHEIVAQLKPLASLLEAHNQFSDWYCKTYLFLFAIAKWSGMAIAIVVSAGLIMTLIPATLLAIASSFIVPTLFLIASGVCYYFSRQLESQADALFYIGLTEEVQSTVRAKRNNDSSWENQKITKNIAVTLFYDTKNATSVKIQEEIKARFVMN